MTKIIIIAVACAVVGSFYIVRGCKVFSCGFGIMKRGILTTGTLERPTEDKLRIERNYVRFMDKHNNEIVAQLPHEIPDDLPNGSHLDIVYDEKKTKNVIVEGYNRFRFMSAAFFQTGIGIMIFNISLYMILIILNY